MTLIERLKTQKVDDETLKRIKTKVRAALIRKLDSNSGMADALTYVLRQLMATGANCLPASTTSTKSPPTTCMRVAKQYLVPETRTVVYTVRLLKPRHRRRRRKGAEQ